MAADYPTVTFINAEPYKMEHMATAAPVTVTFEAKASTRLPSG